MNIDRRALRFLLGSLVVLLAGVSFHAQPAARKDKPMPWVGLDFRWSPGTAKDHWMYVERVTAGGPAERAGVLPGDFITHINDVRVDFGDGLDFLLYLSERKPGERLTMTIRRGGRVLKKQVTLGTMPESARAAWEKGLAVARARRQQVRSTQ